VEAAEAKRVAVSVPAGKASPTPELDEVSPSDGRGAAVAAAEAAASSASASAMRAKKRLEAAKAAAPTAAEAHAGDAAGTMGSTAFWLTVAGVTAVTATVGIVIWRMRHK
jgi:hypothetical protein